MEIEGGNAYLEMLNNGVSEETARAIATGVGGINAFLETAQLDELLKAYKVLNKAGADDAFLDIVLRELKNRGIDTAVETGQEVLQEGVTIGGTQLGSKMDTGEWAYNLGEVGNRLWDTEKESALTFGLTNIPSTAHNVGVQNHNRLVVAGEANILAGKMPTSEQLRAMNMSEAEALGMMAVFQMGALDDAADAPSVTAGNQQSAGVGYTADDSLKNHIENGESNRGQILDLSPALQSRTNRFTGGNTAGSSSSARSAGFPQKRGGRRSPALPVNSQTRCLLSPQRRDFFSLR